MEKSDLEFPIYEDQPEFQSGLSWKMFKVEWLLMGAILFVAIVAWAELLQIVITLYVTGKSDSDPYALFIYTIIITLIAIATVWFFEKQHQKD